MRRGFTVINRADHLHGDPAESEEGIQVGLFTADDVAELPMHPSQRKRLDWAVSREEPYDGPEGD